MESIINSHFLRALKNSEPNKYVPMHLGVHPCIAVSNGREHAAGQHSELISLGT